jgi:hypothetical protein
MWLVILASRNDHIASEIDIISTEKLIVIHLLTDDIHSVITFIKK